MSARRASPPSPPCVPASVFTELESLNHTQLRARWAQLFGTAPPKSFHRRMLARAIAWKLQVNAHGDISPAVHRDLRVAAARARAARVKPAAVPLPELPPASAVIKPGTRLVKIWRGQTYVVDIEAEGVRWNGVLYTSLSAVAKAITGTHWNGLIFFGLRHRTSYGEAAASRDPVLARRAANG